MKVKTVIATRVLVFVLSLTIAAAFTPVFALPQSAEAGTANSSITIGGVEFNTGSTGATVYGITDGNGAVSQEKATSENYNIEWDGSTLTLKDAFITKGAVTYSGTADLSVELNGENIIDLSGLTAKESTTHALYCQKSITFIGSGSLEATANTSDFCEAITSKEGGIVLSGSPDVKGIGASNCYQSEGVAAKTAIIVNGGTLTGIGGRVSTDIEESYSIGIDAGTVIDASGGKVIGYGGVARLTNGNSYGFILPWSSIKLRGNITAVASSANSSVAFFSNAELTIDGPCTIVAESANNTAWTFMPVISDTLNRTVSAGDKAGGADAKVVSVPTESTFTAKKYVKITTAVKPPVPEKDKIYTVGKNKYIVTNASTDGSGTVTLAASTSRDLTSISIGSTVNINGFTYKITAIETSAFKGNTKLGRVVIGSNVVSIGKYAFYGDKKLKTITIKSRHLKAVGKYAISGIYKRAIIKVPGSKYRAYKKLLTKKTGFRSTMKIKRY